MYDPYPEDYPLRDELAQYSQQVLAGNKVACRKHKWACQRFLADLEREGTAAFPFIFDEEKALRFLNWMKLFRHRKGVLRGQRIDPHIIQRFVFGNIYGWIHQATGYRRFRKAYWQVGRKNAKSQSLACVATYEQSAMGEGAAEVYCAATKTKQARIIWEEADAMLRGCDELAGKFKTAYSKIVHLKTDSTIEALSKQDRKEGDGFNPQAGIIDEYHAHETSDFYDILVSGMGARPQPLIMIITTAGFELAVPCYQVEYHYIGQILDPNNPVENDEYFVMVNELDKDEEGNLLDDIKDEAVWEKANPILCSYQEGRDYLSSELKAAVDVPAKMRNFLTKNMNVWVDAHERGYMPSDRWRACQGTIPDLRGADCYIGVDLASKLDLASVSMEFPLDDGCSAVLSHSFIPEDTLAARINRDKQPFGLWVKQGWITAVDGAVIDQDTIVDWVERQVNENGWNVVEIGVDPWNASQFAIDLQNLGFEVVEIIQGIKTLSEPTKHLREMAMKGKIVHNGNPVLAWAMSNAITRQDHNENIMLDKKKSRDKIDPVAALVTAHVRGIHRAGPQKSVYEESGIFFL